MKHKAFFKGLLVISIFTLIMPLPLIGLAEEETLPAPIADVSTEVTASDLGLSSNQANNATTEQTSTDTTTGTLIEIGNTTAQNTTVIIRTTDANGQTEDQTVQVQPTTAIYNNSYGTASLSDWIAGDQISFSATEYTNSGELIAGSLRNKAHQWFHRGKNGWVTAIRPDQNEMDITWNNQTYILNTTDARMVAGGKNPATLSDFQIGDRIRTRVIEDNDNSPFTWKAVIVVVLRRGDNLFMRVTRWVVGAKITTIPEDVSSPVTIEAKILPSAFFQAGDVNNLIGMPGKIIKIDINDQTKLVRKYLGKAFLKEFCEGDEIKIIGRLDEDTGHLVAKIIKNNSLQRIGVVYRLGEVETVNVAASTIDINLIKTRNAIKDWTIKVLPSTKIYKAGEEITISDIQTADKIRIRGGAVNWNERIINAASINVVSVGVPTEETS